MERYDGGVPVKLGFAKNERKYGDVQVYGSHRQKASAIRRATLSDCRKDFRRRMLLTRDVKRKIRLGIGGEQFAGQATFGANPASEGCKELLRDRSERQ
jgi:hypothetical protein